MKNEPAHPLSKKQCYGIINKDKERIILDKNDFRRYKEWMLI